ncbi:MAG TPA: transglutaminase N-terminal domain-containing protein [Hyphomicrobiaceae bacterium]|nr:transglutaminase N-terminal domain-containing protein [Hyphomicrobiaceae bacterium]
MLISVSHVTRYIYDEPVNYTVQSLRLTPAQFKGQRIANWHVRVPGCSNRCNSKTDSAMPWTSLPSTPGTANW